MIDQQSETVNEQLRVVNSGLESLIPPLLADAQHDSVFWLERYTAQIDVIATKVEALEADAAALREALEKIAHPIAWFQHQATVQRAQLNGTTAVMLMQDPGWLRSVAADALSTTAGTALLERLCRAEAERDELRRLLQQQYDRARTESPINATRDNNGED